ncbi:MAG: glucosamine-6-phosphate deaminase [Ktedonobacteraceae bacterium]|nr:glucosamine-6-phosphate deaminase [Ktedonobacteraceae bacterium]
MRLIITESHQAMSKVAARLMADAINANPSLTMVIATGNTPLQAYRELAALRSQGQVNADQIRPFQLDEYKGVPSGDPRSLYDWSRNAFLIPLELPAERLVRLRGDTSDTEEACRRYDDAVEAAGGFDLSILGLGPNGHLGFNEPPSGPGDPTRQVRLTPATLRSNAGYWSEDEASVPREALTCGMKHLLTARQTLLLVSGAHKREILWKTVRGPVTPDVPASYLQQIPGVVVVTDRAAWPYAESSDNVELSQK